MWPVDWAYIEFIKEKFNNKNVKVCFSKYDIGQDLERKINLLSGLDYVLGQAV